MSKIVLGTDYMLRKWQELFISSLVWALGHRQTQTDRDGCPDVADFLAGKTDQGPDRGHCLSVLSAVVQK